MPFDLIKIKPGLNVELTPTANAGGWSGSNLVRFFGGMLQKLGGWSVIAGIPPVVGTARGLFGWSDQVGTPHMAIGTDQRLYVMTGGALADITPIVHTTNTTPALTTTAGSASVVVTDNGYQPNAGDWITFTTPVSQGGIVITGSYQVQSLIGPFGYAINAASPATMSAIGGGTVPSFSSTLASAIVTVTLPNHGLTVGGSFAIGISTTLGTLTLYGSYTITAIVDTNTFQINAAALGSTATATMNSGNMQIQYLVGSGSAVKLSTTGYGMNDWGGGDYGEATGTTGFTIPPRLWSLDHFGQDLIASPDQGGIYYWAPGSGQAIVLSGTAPTINTIVLCVAQAAIVVALGSSVSSTWYPTLIRWCDSADFTDWTATVTNQAGSYQLPSGSMVTAALSTGLGVLIWTDVGLWTMTYQGLPYVFGFNQIGVNCEAISIKSVAAIGNMVIWPSSRSFFVYSGGSVNPIECPIWDIFYDNLDYTQSALVFAAINTLFNEVSWVFPVVGGGTNYIKFNYLEQVWDYGVIDRTAWVDHSPFGNPIGASSAGYLYQHEVSNDADGAPLVCYAQSGYFEMREGTDVQYVNCVIPDFITEAGSQVQITILATDYPGENPRTYGPFTVTSSTTRINCSLRGRQIAFRIGSSDLGSFWRVGAVRYNPIPAGTRP